MEPGRPIRSGDPVRKTDIDTDGTGQPWEYADGWAYRVDGTGPDGTTFELGNWTFGSLDGETTNLGADNPFPIGSYVVPEPATMSLLALGAAGLIRRRK